MQGYRSLSRYRAEAPVRSWLLRIVANDAKIYEKNGPIVDAVGKGEVEVGLVNHYYLYNEFEQRPGSPVANFVPGQEPVLVSVKAGGPDAENSAPRRSE